MIHSVYVFIIAYDMQDIVHREQIPELWCSTSFEHISGDH